MNMKNYKTTDFWLSATLMALGEKLLEVDRSQGRRAIFVFNTSSLLEKHIEEYRQGRLLLEPQSLYIQTKLLKSRLYE